MDTLAKLAQYVEKGQIQEAKEATERALNVEKIPAMEILNKGLIVGLDAVGSGRHRCEAIALEESRVCELPFSTLSHVASQLPGLQRQLLRVMGQSADRDQDHVGVLSRRQAGERVALFLVGLVQRFRRIGHSDMDIQLPMSRDEIARYLGLALETVSRGFRYTYSFVIRLPAESSGYLKYSFISFLFSGLETCISFFTTFAGISSTRST